jgi:glutaredoxin 3
MDHAVIVYSAPACSWCQAVKEYLSAHDVPFDDIDVSADINRAREMVEKSGQYGVPVIDIDGEIVVGFDRPRINELLGIG